MMMMMSDTNLDERTRHAIQEALGEPGGLIAACGVDHVLGALQVGLKGAAQELNVGRLGLARRLALLVQALDPDLQVKEEVLA